jgi:hypothetical protein
MVVVLSFGGGSVREGQGVGKGFVEGGAGGRVRRRRVKGPVDLSSAERAKKQGRVFNLDWEDFLIVRHVCGFSFRTESRMLISKLWFRS